MLFAAIGTAAMLMGHPAKAGEPSTTAQAAANVLSAGEGMPVGVEDLLIAPSEYWLGVMISTPSPEAREKLSLPKDRGLLVENVEPDSPAAKAGLRPHDALMKANDKPLGDLRDLLKLMNQVKEGKLTFDVFREGKHETIVATLAKRPTKDTAEARAWIEKLRPKMAPGQPLTFHIVGPGQIVPYGLTKLDVTVHTKASLADGSEIEITRHSGDPAKVVVTHDKDQWEGTSADLSKIPENIRPEVERLLGSPAGHMQFFASPDEAMPGNTMTFSGRAPQPGEIVAGPNVEKRLGEMQKQIDDLRKQVEALQTAAKPKKE
jgi:hypothetical protein